MPFNRNPFLILLAPLASAMLSVPVTSYGSGVAAEPHASSQDVIVETSANGATRNYVQTGQTGGKARPNPARDSPGTRTARPFVLRKLAEMETAADGLETVKISADTGLATFIATRRNYPIAGYRSRSAPPAARARSFMDSYGPAFGINNSADLAHLKSTETDEVGMEHVRYRQTHRGVPITGGEITVHMRGVNLVAVNAKTLDDAELEGINVLPTLSATNITDIVLQILEKSEGITDASLSEPRLEIFSRALLEGGSSLTRLAWFVEATKTDLREFFWIDAHTGTPILQFSQLPDARDREVYDANDPGDGIYDDIPGTLVRTEGGAAVAGAAAADANDAYDYSGDAYDYFFNEHGRDSYDDAGAKLISTVRFCPDAGRCPYANAFWNGAQMVYGAGFSAADDVAAHELTHAVTEHTANLFYYMQSGALNESFSDIFGESVDLGNGSGTDTAPVRWQMGEDIPSIGAIRNMEDPTLFSDPGKMSDSGEFVCDTPGGDQGGVHSNSGVPNHAFVLMADGGSYNGKTVSGIGLAKAGKIQYRALAHYLNSASNLLDNYNALKQSCQDLIGVDGISVSTCIEVGNALDAVEMGDPWPCTPTQASIPEFCPTGQAPNIWHFADMSNLSGLSDCPSNSLPGGWCVNKPESLLGAFATSGGDSIWGYDIPSAGYLWLALAPANTSPATLPDDAYMHFFHSYGFENFSSVFYYDGGVVELSSNSGSNWSDGGPLIVEGQGYGGTIKKRGGNPIEGRSAFVGDSWGYTASKLDLSSLSGDPFAYRFYIGTDAYADDYGWFVDDVRIYTCATCLTDWVLTDAHSGTAPLFQANNTVFTGSGFTVAGGEEVHLKAGAAITLGPGTVVYEGGSLKLEIDANCP